MLGHKVGRESPIVPPHTGEFLATSYCPSECLDAGLDNQDIYLFANILHSHLLGSKMRLRLIRNGTELPPISEDNNYDFNYQEARKLPKEITLTKGDIVIMECVYNSKLRNHTTYGGFSTQHEMCLSFTMFYPRSPLTNCQTTPLYSNLDPQDWVKDNFDWSKSSDTQRFQELTNKVDVRSQCRGLKEFNAQGKTYRQADIQPSKRYIPPKVCN